MKTEIYAIHTYGAIQVTFRKTFDLPFAPFIGMFLLDEVEENECQIEFAKNQYVDTLIFYYPKRKMFTVDVRERWLNGVSDEAIDDTINIFSKCGWERTDNTNITELKELSKRDYERLRK